MASAKMVRELWRRLQGAEPLQGWTLCTIKDGTDGICLEGVKRVLLGLACDCPRNLLLHEAAHILTPGEAGTRHGVDWFMEYTRLLYLYLPGSTPNLSAMSALAVNRGWPASKEGADG